MKNHEDFINRLTNIPNFPLSEEMLGAFIENKLDNELSNEIRNIVDKNAYLQEIVSQVEREEDTTFPNNPLLSDFHLPQIFGLGEENINEDNVQITDSINLNAMDNSIDEAKKQFGLEPLDINFNPNIFQWEEDTCAIRSQEIVLRSFGKFISQDELIKEAQDNGWYSPGVGTSIEDVGNLLDLHGISNHRVVNANVFNLVDELGAGHKVIVGVDIKELYGNPFWQSIKEHLIGRTPNHAMIVSGIDTSDIDNVMVVLTDPGTGKTLFKCPYERFLSAWDDSTCFMVATDDSAPLEYNQNEMINFDYSKGHVSSFGNIPYYDLHNKILPEAQEYIDSLDKYIEAIERVINTDFNYNEFRDMLDKGEITHNKSIDAKHALKHNLSELANIDENNEKGLSNENPIANNETDSSYEQGNQDEDNDFDNYNI